MNKFKFKYVAIIAIGILIFGIIELVLYSKLNNKPQVDTGKVYTKISINSNGAHGEEPRRMSVLKLENRS